MKTLKEKILWIIFLIVIGSNVGILNESFSTLHAQEEQTEEQANKDEKNNEHQVNLEEQSDKHAKSHDDSHGSHGDEIAPIYILISALIFGAVLGRFIAKAFNQPAVLGELIIGLIFGAILYQSYQPVMIIIRHNDKIEKIVDYTLNNKIGLDEAIKREIPEKDLQKGKYGEALTKILHRKDFSKYLQMVIALKIFSAFGVILLLFMVGLECSYTEMKAVGVSSFSAAIVGIVAPFFMGFYVTKFLVPGLSANVYIFVGATLCATSIGITARVFKDMNKLGTPEAKVVMGAAVIDDILGLIILAVVTGIIATGHIEFQSVALIIIKAFLFLFISIFVVGKFLSKYTYHLTVLDRSNARLLFTLSLLMLFAWASDKIGLASIVGAFAAGLILEEKFFSEIKNDHFTSIESAISPIEGLFAPIFFVMMGMIVDVTTFLDPTTIKIALSLTAVAIIGKIIAGWAVQKGLNKIVIGIGLVPRGEVGLIFASIGKTIGVLDEGMFSAIIAVVILTTFVTPPALKWCLEKMERQGKNEENKNESKNKESEKENIAKQQESKEIKTDTPKQKEPKVEKDEEKMENTTQKQSSSSKKKKRRSKKKKK